MASAPQSRRQIVHRGFVRPRSARLEGRFAGHLRLGAAQPCSAVAAVAGHSGTARFETESLRGSVVDLAAARMSDRVYLGAAGHHALGNRYSPGWHRGAGGWLGRGLAPVRLSPAVTSEII